MLLFMLGIRNSSKRMTAVSYDFFIAEKRSSYFFIAKSKPLKVITWLEITDFTSSFSSLYPQRFLHPLRHTGAQITLQSRPVQTVLHAVVQINKPQTARHNHPRFTPKEEGNNIATLNEYQSDGLKTLCVS